MAYTGNTLSVLAQTIEGYFHIYVYITFDTIAEVLAANYISDGVDRGMKIGDFVYAVTGGVPFSLFVSSVSGVACTLASAAIAFDGNDLPVTNPGVGSGLLWNDGGFVVVA